jgi:hypothetical protein
MARRIDARDDASGHYRFVDYLEVLSILRGGFENTPFTSQLFKVNSRGG